MKILHIVTLHTPDHAFGGPTRVALNLSKVQRADGDDARIMALGDGFGGVLPDTVEGVPVHLFQARHLLPMFEVSGITSGALLRTARRMMRGADLVHVHLMRDLVTLPAALLALATRTPSSSRRTAWSTRRRNGSPSSPTCWASARCCAAPTPCSTSPRPSAST